MIHIGTVHWRTNKWIDIQLSHLRKHLRSPYRIYAWFNDAAPEQTDLFFFSCFEPVREHETKLNILGDIICASSGSDDDILIFLDGDAFPVADVEPYLADKLPRHKLLAVQRRENNGDIQPHPCFCATTVGFWKEIKGDWKRGHKWQDRQGQWITDVGGNLLKQLQDRQVNWYPMLRSNRHNPHPVLFGLYDSVIYHHGAGFRSSSTRWDEMNRKERGTIVEKALSTMPWFRDKMRQSIREQNSLTSEQIFGKIRQGGDFVSHFM